MDVLRPGEGPLLCGSNVDASGRWPGADGRPCTRHEVTGMGYCVYHMPDEMLDEAEAITNWRRCRHKFGEGQAACHDNAVKGTEPARCRKHGAGRGSIPAQRAAQRLVDGQIADRLVVILAENGEKLMRPDPIGNPLTELLDLAAEVKAFKEVMRSITAYLVQRQQARQGSRVGEQLRAEVVLYERAQERLGKLLMDISRLGIEARLAQIQEHQVQLVERALAAALTASGLGLVEQQEAKQVLRRELTRVAS